MRRPMTVITISLIVAVTSVTAASSKDMRRRVISGDRIMVQGVVIQLKDTHCPPDTTDEAREARRIVGIMLFARKLQCSYKDGPQGHVGDCIYGPSASSRVGRSMVEELKRRNLCQKFGRT